MGEKLKGIIIIPTYNEAKNLPKIVQDIFSLDIPTFGVCVVDDGSPDGTGRVADELSERYPERVFVIHRAGKLGLGTAYIRGFCFALEKQVDIIGQMDADFSHPVEKIPELLKALEQADGVLGSRYVKGGKLDTNWSVWRKYLSRFGNFYARAILNLKIRDVTGGFRFWKRYVMENMPFDRIRSNGYAFQIETVYIATRMGYRFKEVPIYFSDRLWGKSKMSFRIQIEAALQVWKMLYRYKDIRPKHEN